MPSDDDERPPKELLQPLTQFQAPQSNLASSPMITQTASAVKKPYQITFSSRDEEIKYTQKLLDNCTLYNGHLDNLMPWLRGTGAFIVKERYPETDHPFIIRYLLTNDALDYYLAHEDTIFNFYDLRALDWFQDSKTNFKNSWSVFVDHFKKTFDSPTRARIAMKKLNSYAQSPNQDVRRFCSEIRKLFSEADSHMSSSMKLEFLLAKVNPTYRLDLLKQKPKDTTEFESMARDIENIYLVHEVIEQNTQFNTPCSASMSTLLPDSSHQPLSNYQQSPRTTNYNSNNRYTSSLHNKTNYSPQFSFRPSSRQHHTPSFQSSTNRQFGSAANPRNITRQNLFNFQIPSSTQQLQPPLSTLNIPPLMPPSSSVPSTQLSQPTSTVAAITCQWCSQSGHSARDCPF
ncbi:unnamed protein product [Rotaria socialis]|uniref:CCHC-type domain-containing protein n=3 Tax=Rotaria socialis TaxID=392032 RepID=A0A820ZRD8_9BILA|nr:unnamed protein product [Rotaria socialis]CAF4566109.1 unnamed protein product [Rotaria socialis]